MLTFLLFLSTFLFVCHHSKEYVDFMQYCFHLQATAASRRQRRASHVPGGTQPPLEEVDRSWDAELQARVVQTHRRQQDQHVPGGHDGAGVEREPVRHSHHVASQRRKIKLKRQRSRDSDEDSEREVISIDSSDDSPSKTPKKCKVKREADNDKSPPAPADEDADGDKIRHYGSRARVSLVDAEGRAMAHGVVLDDEPKIPDDESGLEYDHPWTAAHEELPNCRVGSFKQVKLVAIVRSLHFLSFFGFICALR